MISEAYKSRKLFAGTMSSAALMLGALLCAKVPAFIPAFGEYVTGILGVFAIYSSGNVGAKFVHRGTTSAVTRAQSKAKPEPTNDLDDPS